jgi:hypothetical protein
MSKRKRSKKEIFEQAKRRAENDQIGRDLRRHIARIEAELSEHRRVSKSSR